MPTPEDWNSWLVFEGIYEDALHKIRQVIVTFKGRDIKKLYETKTIYPKLQAAREEVTETLIQRQSAQIHLTQKSQIFLEEIRERETEEQDTRNEAAVNRKVIEWTQKISQIFDRIPEETRREKKRSIRR
jgi:hypothetical protein